MKISTRFRYGVRASLEIACSFNKDFVKRRTIAENQSVSDSYLENILIDLKTHGIINTVRGAKGGYTLSRSPESISLLQIMEALDGTVSPVDCVDNADYCERRNNCVMLDVYRELKQANESVLGSTTLADLLGRSDKLQTFGDGI